MEIYINPEKDLNFGEIPRLPGCYIFRNKLRHIIYIGKSKSLYNRIKQHFKNTDPKDYKHIDLMRELCSIEIIETDTETDALILECKLIRTHKPRYNSQLKKASVFPFIRIDHNRIYPSITITDNIAKDGCKYYGSFYSTDDAFNTLELINNIWQTPVCCKESFNVHRPCLNYHLKKCCAPCCGGIDSGSFRLKIEEIVKCLNGNFRNTFNRLKSDMTAASDEMDFEKAARLRDNIAGLERLKIRQQRLYTDLDGKDVYLFFRAFGEKCFSVFFIKNGIAINRVNFPDIEDLNKNVMTEFIEANMHNNTAIEDGDFLTSCLLEIGARKLFIPVSRRLDGVKVLGKIEKSFKDFVN